MALLDLSASNMFLTKINNDERLIIVFLVRKEILEFE